MLVRNLKPVAAYDKVGFIGTVGLAALLALSFGNATGRNFHHYYVMHAPWFALLAGLLLERAVRGVGTTHDGWTVYTRKRDGKSCASERKGDAL